MKAAARPRTPSLPGWAVVLALATAPATAGEPLRAAVSTSWAPPFLITTPEGGYRGIIPDWYQALGAALGQPLALDYLPPRRLEQQGRRQDLRCFGAREWGRLEPGFVDAAQPFMHVDEVLAGPTGRAGPASLAQLKGERIGTVVSYGYPTLEEAFRSGRLRREDAPNEIKMLHKQLQGRTDYVVIRRLTLEHLRLAQPQWRALSATPVRVSSTGLYCGVREGGGVTLAALQAAQARLLRDGTLQRVLNRYTAPVTR